MFDIFTYREIATGLWGTVFIIAMFAIKKNRILFFDVVKIVLSKQFLLPIIIMISYAFGSVLLFRNLPFWNWKYVKEISIWVIFIGIPTCYSAIKETQVERYLKKIIINNIKLCVIIEFIISSFSFHFAIELVLVPIFVLLFILQIIVSTKEDLKPIHTFVSFLIIITTSVFLILTARKAIIDYINIGIVDSIIKFCIPLIYTIVYLPFIYIFIIFVKYQNIFIKINSRTPDDLKIKRKYKRKIFKVCFLSYKQILRFNDYLPNVYINMGEDEFNKLLVDFKYK